jgi:hypothetical protein
MPECRHHAICGLTDEADPGAGLCILHSHQADKDPDAFTTALRKHRETLGNRFTSMVFPKADFTGESFTTSAIFAKVTFAAGATFVRTTFGEDADFNEAIFAASADFSGANFDERPLFFTNFAAEANFSGATFNKGADFGAATFKGLANFGRAKFFARTDFSRAKFFGRLNFSRATFQNPQPYVTVGAWVGFTGASFSGSVDFHEATFAADADFEEATFKDLADFHRATFAKWTYFGSTKFSGRVNFFRATFTGEANFLRTTFATEANFEETDFSASVNFLYTNFAARANFHGSQFRGRTLFTGGHVAEEPHFCLLFTRATEVDFRDLVIASPESLSFRHVDFRTCRFLNTDLRKIELTGVRWPEKTVRWRKKGTRHVVYDEIAPVSGAPPWDELERLYRELKQNYDDRRNYPRAGDFHYGEKEMQRRNPATPRSLKVFLWLYWLVSGYGEHFLRPLLWALGLLVLATWAYMWLGLVPKGGRAPLQWTKVKDWGLAVDYGLRVMTLLRPDDLVLEGYARHVNTLQSLLGPLFLGLFALAVRQRLKH